MSAPTVTLKFFAGTVEVHGDVDAVRALVDDGVGAVGVVHDARTGCLRGPAVQYAPLLLWLLQKQKAGAVVVVDEARRYEELPLVASGAPVRRGYQEQALLAWQKARGRGVVVLPTGAGKTEVALSAIAERPRNALVVAPTLDLVRQWHQALTLRFGDSAGVVGVVGGGDFDVRPLTVTTYDSAWAHMEHLGNRFGVVVFDEVHHLVSDSYALAARLCLAPFRLGLTATPERADGKEALLAELIGPIVFRTEIDALEGTYLADYDVVTVDVALTDDERVAFDDARATYRAFVKDNKLSLGSPEGFSRFLRVASTSQAGRRALACWRLQRKLAFCATQKLEHVGNILAKHNDTRALIFTDDNATAYAVSRRFLVPVISHQTKVKERTALLAAFADGTLPVLATSRVLNEGIDVPDAQVAIVLSGTGSTREHVQRLGRILRPRPGKRAVLYELVSANTGETFTSERRRDHVAYR